MLLRHAKSDWSQAGIPDHDRALAPRGRAAAMRMGAHLAARALIPDCVSVSTALRTRDTWSLIAPALPARQAAFQAVFDERIYEASAAALLAVIRETPPACRSLLMVGHNPGLQSLALLLVKGGKGDALARLAEKFPTAALAVIDLPAGGWADIRAGSGRLESFVVPRLLEEAD
jgi:phosphohistidine phosphatase